MRVVRLGLIATILSTTFVGVAQAQAPTNEKEVTTQVATTLRRNNTVQLLWETLNHPKVPKYARSTAFWDAIAQCETAQEWDRGKDWGVNARSYVSGGLGLANVTFRGYGGLAFAPKAALATRSEQIIIAVRVGFIGYQTKHVFLTLDDKINNRPHFRPPAGFSKGWGGTCREQFIRAWKKDVKLKP